MRTYRNYAAAGALSGLGVVAAVLVVGTAYIDLLAWVINVGRRQ